MDYIREDYQFLGDDLSQYISNYGQESALSYPLCKEDLRIDTEDPREKAELEVFREKIKSKFNFNNTFAVCNPNKHPAAY